MEDFCRRLPKTELHAHLNGSCSEKTIKKLLEKSKRECIVPMMQCNSLASCFETFKLLHELCDNDEAIYLITKDVIEDFAAENVKYLELRTTPKANAETGMTKNSYIESVLSAVKDSDVCLAGLIIVRIIISIDRGRSLEDAWENLELAKSYREKFAKEAKLMNLTDSIIVGIDLSGNPETADAIKFVPVLKAAKEAQFKLTIHLAEIQNRTKEAGDLLSVMPDRVGHATFLLPQCIGCDELIEHIVQYKIPLELCITSNIVGGTVPSLEEHHIEFWSRKSQPLSICTDDKGVFSTTLSREFFLAHKLLNLSQNDLWKISYDSINHIFADDATKDSLRNSWTNFNFDV